MLRAGRATQDGPFSDRTGDLEILLLVAFGSVFNHARFLQEQSGVLFYGLQVDKAI